MRHKPVPPVRSQEGLATVRGALPLVPGSTDDCCRRLLDRTDVSDRETARAWLTFLVAIDAAARDGDSYYRDGDLPDTETIASAFRANVLGAAEVLATLSDDPISADIVFEATRNVVPEWERNRDPEWETTWRDRTERLLEWAVVFELVERTENGYRRRE